MPRVQLESLAGFSAVIDRLGEFDEVVAEHEEDSSSIAAEKDATSAGDIKASIDYLNIDNLYSLRCPGIISDVVLVGVLVVKIFHLSRTL